MVLMLIKNAVVYKSSTAFENGANYVSSPEIGPGVIINRQFQTSMPFNSFPFFIFFPVTTLVYFLIPHRFRWLQLLIASCIFYCAFIPAYLFILLFTIIVDYFAGLWIEKSTGSVRKLFLILSLVSNLGILAFFKYYNFFSENLNALIVFFGAARQPIPLLNIILPM